METKFKETDGVFGEKVFQVRARKALPFLVRQAKARKPIFYSSLAEIIDISNERHFNKILDAIAISIEELRVISKKNIPHIEDIVINKTTELPGYYKNEPEFKNLSKENKRKRLDIRLLEIYEFKHWDWVLAEFGLSPIKFSLNDDLNKVSNKHGFGGGESDEHKIFKLYISNNPQILGLSENIKPGITEYQLPSNDSIDVLFKDKDLVVGVEVKSKISLSGDILRGLFQCVKYKSLIEAEQIVNDEYPKSRVILALQGEFPDELTIVKNILEIEVIDKININR